MLIDRGFYVENYVGTYKMQYDEELDAMMIVSEEYNGAQIGENPLVKKRIFDFDNKEDDYIFLNLCNLDITSDIAILEYFNKYGLPCSSQICYDKEYSLGADVNYYLAKTIRTSNHSKYSRQDTMSREEFCRLAIQVRKMMELKTIIDSKDINEDTCVTLIHLLFFFTFFSHEFYYNFNELDEFPLTRTVRMQYAYHIFCRNNKAMWELPMALTVIHFLNHAQCLLNNPKSPRVKERSVLADVGSETFAQLSRIVTDILYETDGNNVNDFIDRQYGLLEFAYDVKYEGSKEELLQLGEQVLCDLINEGMGDITPRLVVDNGNIRGEWQLDFQMQGIYMEFFSELAQNCQYRKCQNPTCGIIFSASRNRPNKKYCCHGCAVLEAKRRERRRAKSLSQS